MTEPCENCGNPVVHGSRLDLRIGRERCGLDVTYGPFDHTTRLWERRDFIDAEEVADMLGIEAGEPAYEWRVHTPDRCRSARTRRQETRGAP